MNRGAADPLPAVEFTVPKDRMGILLFPKRRNGLAIARPTETRTEKSKSAMYKMQYIVQAIERSIRDIYPGEEEE